MGEDPHFNDLTMNHQELNGHIYPKGVAPQVGPMINYRYRNKRGAYRTKVETSNSPRQAFAQPSSSTRGTARTA